MVTLRIGLTHHKDTDYHRRWTDTSIRFTTYGLPNHRKSVQTQSLSVVIVGIIQQKPVLTYASIVCEGTLASVNSVKR